MGWLDRKRDKLVTQWEQSCRVTADKTSLVVARTVRSIPGAMEVRVRQLSHANAQEIGLCTGQGTSISSFELGSAVRNPNPLLLSFAHEWPAELTVARARVVTESLDVRIWNLDITAFAVVVKRFVFDIPKREPTSQSALPKGEHVKGKKLESVTRAERPKPEKAVDLQALLLRLLAPPVNALLSDPQLTLPEKPFKFQLEGIQWLMDRPSALLADEMGLGKTMQAILAARLLWKAGTIKNVLVICPKFLMANWEREIRYWWPQAADHVWKVDGNCFHSMVGSTGGNYIFKLLNYELARGYVDWLKDHAGKHDVVIIDEAQHIKDGANKTSRAIQNLRGQWNWALTGTPVENHKANLVSLFAFVKPGVLDREMSEQELSIKKKPYFLRRRTDEVGIQLPELVDEDLYLDLGPAQRSAYDKMESEGVANLNSKGDEVTVTHVFQLIRRLQQWCNFEPVSGESAKFEALEAELEEIEESKKKALVFLNLVSAPFGLKQVSSLLGNKRKVLELHGEIPQGVRQAAIDRFKNDPAVTAFLLNYKVGGAGLNLQSASYVFLFDRWWNPAVEQQALKRAHRIGQQNKVFVRRFVCRGTIEERIVEKLAEKKELIRRLIEEDKFDENRLKDEYVDAHPVESTLLSEEELFSLFNLRVKPKGRPSPQPMPMNFENLNPLEFEELVAKIYAAQGYDVGRVGGSGDGGIDVVAKKGSSGGGEVLAIQCKHYSGTVGVSVARDLFGALNHDQSITRGVIAISSTFSNDMRAFVTGKRITLLDGAQIRELAVKLRIATFG
ncbi:MAG TPA: SNF2-related protein [Planctomycetota bacterium]|nr:SNF2-related protein [Planctomycetota bacterium]